MPGNRTRYFRSDLSSRLLIINFSILVSLLVALLTATCGVRERPSISVWGDSLTAQAEPALAAAGVHVHAMLGLAPCDFLATYDALLAAEKPTVVVFAFAGNIGSPCMAGTRTSRQLVARYHDTLSRMVGAAINRHIQVILMLPLVMSPRRAPKFALLGLPELGQMECSLAATAPLWASCNAGVRTALSPAGVFTSSVDGHVARLADGVHLTPYGAGLWAKAVEAVAGGNSATG